MALQTILVLHAPDDARDAFRMAEALSAASGGELDVRPLPAVDDDAPGGLDGVTDIVLIASEAAVASLAVSLILDDFLEANDRERVFPIVSSRAAGQESANAFISPLLKYQRTSDDGLLESVMTPVSVAGDLRTETARAIADRLSSKFPAQGLFGLQRFAERPGVGWGVAAGLALLAGVFGVEMIDRDRQLAEADLAIHQARVESTRLLARLEDTLPADARREVFARLGEDVILMAGADAPDASEEDLSRLAQLLHVVGEARRENNDVDGAFAAFNAAAGISGQLLAMAPEDPQRIFDHAQSVFWIGDLGFISGRYEIAAEQYAEYERLAALLIEIDPENPVYRGEWAYAQINSGIIDLEFDNWTGALARFDLAAELFQDGLIEQGVISETSLANAYGWAAAPLRSLGRLTEAAERRQQEIAILVDSLAENPESRTRRNRLLSARTALAILQMDLGDLDAAQAQIDLAGELASDLSAEWPANRSILRQHLTLERQRARLALWRGDLRTAQLINARARLEFANSADAEIDDHRYVDAAYFDLLAGEIAISAGAYDAALSSAAAALVSFERDIRTTGSRLRHFAAASLLIQGQALDAIGGRGEAERAWRAGLAHIDAMPEPRDLRAEDYRARLLWELEQRDAAEAIRTQLAASEYNRPDFRSFWNQPESSVNTASATLSEEQDG
ncbi:hypothetical protein [Hyphobacterium sp.]|jgi:hypothetical protein|uniref:hypothetical protein n=1 Tax=Hyphobacterium sp. TaxID=2004662 RepID=UPI003BAB9240